MLHTNQITYVPTEAATIKNDIPTKCAIVARTERQFEGLYRSQHVEAIPFKTRVTLHTNNNCLVQQEHGNGDKPRAAVQA